jgi:hypothetical protein
MKYKHVGMTRNFIQNKTDLTEFYVNRAKTDIDKHPLKIVDTRRVRVPRRMNRTVDQQQQTNRVDMLVNRPLPLPLLAAPVQVQQQQVQMPVNFDYRFLLAWSYYLATQSSLISSGLVRQPYENEPINGNATSTFLQAMTLMGNTAVEHNKLASALTSTNESRAVIEPNIDEHE